MRIICSHRMIDPQLLAPGIDVHERAQTALQDTLLMQRRL